jgi:hypothetical protein
MGGLSLEVRHTKQPSLILTLNKKTRAFEQSCTVSQDGAIGPIFEGDMPLEKMTPKSGAVNGTITGILLKMKLSFFVFPSQNLCVSCSKKCTHSQC